MDALLLFENISLAFSSLLANKMRALLTMLGIIIGIGAVIAIKTVGNSLTVGFTSEMEGMGANNVTVMLQQKQQEEESDQFGMMFAGPSVSRNIAEEDLMTDEMIEDLMESLPDEIKGVGLESRLGSGSITVNGKSVNVEVGGYNDQSMKTADLEMVCGKELDDKEFSGGKGVGIISDFAAQKLFKTEDAALGQSVVVTIGRNFYTIVVIGVYKYESQSIMSNANDDPVTNVYMPLKYVQKKSHVDGYRQVTVVAATGVDADLLQSHIKGVLDRYYHANENFAPETMSMASLVSSMTEMLGTISMAISIIGGISLLVGGIGVMNIMLVSISERTREIGTRKALGATNGSIRTQFIVESIILCMIGGIFGIILGVSGGSFAATKMGYDAAPSVSSIVSSVVFSMAIGVFFGYYPANKAAKMNPIDALRYE